MLDPSDLYEMDRKLVALQGEYDDLCATKEVFKNKFVCGNIAVIRNRNFSLAGCYFWVSDQ